MAMLSRKVWRMNERKTRAEDFCELCEGVDPVWVYETIQELEEAILPVNGPFSRVIGRLTELTEQGIDVAVLKRFNRRVASLLEIAEREEAELLRLTQQKVERERRKAMSTSIERYTHTLKSGIRETLKFAEKGLADYGVNVGLRCGHECTYCSSPALLRCHPAFKEIGRSPFESGFGIVDPDSPRRVAKDAARIKKRGLVQLCTTVDAWCPLAQEFDLGRRCLEALLGEPDWMVRVLTKNAAVASDFDVMEKHRARVLIGLSITGTSDRDEVLSVVEPNASTNSDRMVAMMKAHEMGLRTYGMLCPLLPGIADGPDQIEELVAFCRACGVEEIFVESVNARGPGLKNTEEALRVAGFLSEAEAVSRIRMRTNWSGYTTRLVANVQTAMRKHDMLDKLRFLLYSSSLSPEDEAEIRKDDVGVIWL